MSQPLSSQDLDALIRPMPKARYEVSVGLGHLQTQLDSFDRDYGLELSPDFQRGHVWTQEQQERWIEAVIRGAISSSGLIIQFNHPEWDDLCADRSNSDLPAAMQCIDGLQRVTAALRFLRGEIKAFGLTAEDFKGTNHDIKRLNFRLIFAVHSFKTRKEVLKYYLDINDGGTPHSPEEIERVRLLLTKAESVGGADVQTLRAARPKI